MNSRQASAPMSSSASPFSAFTSRYRATVTSDRGICIALPLHIQSVTKKEGKISVSELHFFLNIRTVLHKIIINKRINYLISDGKSSINHSNNMYYFHSQSANDSQSASEVPIRNFFRGGLPPPQEIIQLVQLIIIIQLIQLTQNNTINTVNTISSGSA